MIDGEETLTLPIPLLVGLSVSELGEADLLVLQLNCMTKIGDGPMAHHLLVAVPRDSMRALGEALIRSSEEERSGDLDLLIPAHGHRPN